MTGAAGLCARAAYRAGAGMVRLGIPGGDLAELPVSEAVGATLPAAGWAADALAMARAVPGPGGRSRARAGRRHRRRRARPRGRAAGAGGGRRGRPLCPRHRRRDRRASCAPAAGGRRRAHPARRGVRPPGGRRPGRRPDRRRRGAGRSAAARWCCSKGPTTVVADPAGTVLLAMAGSPRLATAGTGDVLSGVDRRVHGPGRRPARTPPPWPRTSTVGPPSSAPPRASWPATSPISSAGGCRGSAGEPRRVRRRRRTGRRVAPGVGRDRPGRRPAQRVAAARALAAPAALCAVVKADGYGHGAVRRGPGRAGGRRHLAGGGHAPKRAWRCATRASPRPCSCCPSRRPRPWRDVVGRGLTLALYSLRGVRGRRRRPRRAPGWSPTST